MGGIFELDMNQKILQKVLDNLNTDKPDLSYIRGMIETLLALGETKTDEDKFILANGDGTVRVTTHAKEIAVAEKEIDEGAILDAQARAAVAAVAELTGKTVETA